MHAVILAAGEGSRMGPRTEDIPKAFMAFEGRTLFDRQRAVLGDHVDDITIVLGYAAENVTDRVGSANVVVVEDWDECDNAESLRRALAVVDDDVLVLNGDVVVAESVVRGMIAEFSSLPAGTNTVACIPGHQEGSTAIQVDENGTVADYGMITGHRHAGFGILDRANVDAAERFLRDYRTEWYPVVYPEFETRMVPIGEDVHVEINRPQDMRSARRKFSRLASDEADA